MSVVAFHQRALPAQGHAADRHLWRLAFPVEFPNAGEVTHVVTSTYGITTTVYATDETGASSHRLAVVRGKDHYGALRFLDLEGDPS